MNQYAAMSRTELQAEYERLIRKYQEFQAQGLKLDMSRGRPGTDQLDLSTDILDVKEYIAPNGFDCRNYGMPNGVHELAEIFAQMMEVPVETVVLGGASSLNMMFDKVADAMVHGVGGGAPWLLQGGIKFLCPAPGYDRHFSICEYFNIEMITIPMTETGPDMDMVERLVSADEKIKGIWCVPKYSNPQGITYSDETVRRFAALKPAAKDFRIFWDNAYCIHHISDTHEKLLPLYEECVKNGTEDMVIMYASTSKITLPGAGVAAMATSPKNQAWDRKRTGTQRVCPDKMNMMRHLAYLKNFDGLLAKMEDHARLLRPKFEALCAKLETEFAGTGLLNWHRPNGGYFVSVDTLSGCAKRVVELCAQGGVKLTGAGATYPYKKDPQDTNIRLAPTGICLAELTAAAELFCICVKLASAEKLLAE